MNLKKVVSDISGLKVQGAENIAKASVKMLKYTALKSYTTSAKQFKLELVSTQKSLIDARPTEPCLRNTLKFITHDISNHNLKSLQEKIISNCQKALRHFSDSNKVIVEIGAKKIKSGMTVYTHCHSSTVLGILKKAHDKGTRFKACCTETRPKFQGRITASDLAKYRVPVTLFVDSAMRQALKKSDIAFLGADAITTEGKVINKIGSEMVAILCNKYDVPLYSCSNSWKFDPETVFGFEEPIEKRSEKEVWDKAPNKVEISNFAFESVDSSLITGIISELGIYRPDVFVEEVKQNYPWMFKEIKKFFNMIF